MNEASKPYIVVAGRTADPLGIIRGANSTANDTVSVTWITARTGFHETHAGPSCFMLEHTSAGRHA
jgi:hypothetical protein